MEAKAGDIDEEEAGICQLRKLDPPLSAIERCIPHGIIILIAAYQCFY